MYLSSKARAFRNASNKLSTIPGPLGDRFFLQNQGMDNRNHLSAAKIFGFFLRWSLSKRRNLEFELREP